MELEGYGKKSVDKILMNIENSKKEPLSKLLFALGIRYVGKKTAQILAKKFITIENIERASYEELKEVKDEIITTLADKLVENDKTISITALKELRKHKGMKFEDDNLKSSYNKYMNSLYNHYATSTTTKSE